MWRKALFILLHFDFLSSIVDQSWKRPGELEDEEQFKQVIQSIIYQFIIKNKTEKAFSQRPRVIASKQCKTSNMNEVKNLKMPLELSKTFAQLNEREEA